MMVSGTVRWAACAVIAAGWIWACPTLGGEEAPEGNEPLSVRAARADLDQIIDIVDATHPDLSFSASRSALEEAKAGLKREIQKPLSRQEFWMIAAKLNPVFADAHVGVRYPVAAFKAYREAGGLAFPAPVYVDERQRIRLAEGIPQDAPVSSGDEILSINAIAAAEIVKTLSSRMRGETVSLQRFVMGYNFPAYFWTAYGSFDDYTVVLRTDAGDTKTVQLTAPLLEEGENTPFWSDVLAGGVGYLRVASFDQSLTEEFASFLEAAFNAFDSAQVQKLIIDVRDNPGGAHDVSDLLVPYLTDKSIAPTSALKARIVEANIGFMPGAAIGDVVEVPFSEPIKGADRKPAFDGPIYGLVSRNTYSQAIVFATMLKKPAATPIRPARSPCSRSTSQVFSWPHQSTYSIAPMAIGVREA